MSDSPVNVPRLHRVVASDSVPDKQGLVAFLSSSTRRGRWALPRQMRVASVLGSVELDLREADLASGVSEIEVFALFGSVEITVPVGVRVECVGQAMLGNFESQLIGILELPADAPTLRIRGTAYLSSVEVTVKHLTRKQLRAEERLRLGKG